MRAMVLRKPGMPLVPEERPTPSPGQGELLVRVEACAVCRTDLHVIDGELQSAQFPIIPGHEIVGIVEATGDGVPPSRLGTRVGIPWLGHTCGHCEYCQEGLENLCDRPLFTGYTRDGGYASHAVADSDFAFDLPMDADPVSTAPLLCAGLIGWRSLVKAGDGKRLGLYGFGAAAHIVAQVCRWQGRRVFAFTSPGDGQAQRFALELGAVWVGASNEAPPEALDAAIIFAPVGDLVAKALRVVRKGGRVVCGGIHMSDIPQMPYRLLWEERSIMSVANLTRKDAVEFLPIAQRAAVKVKTATYPLSSANDALDDLRHGRLTGAAVLIP